MCKCLISERFLQVLVSLVVVMTPEMKFLLFDV
jgi:hypothetical protein